MGFNLVSNLMCHYIILILAEINSKLETSTPVSNLSQIRITLKTNDEAKYLINSISLNPDFYFR
jgi:hypothetical protein